MARRANGSAARTLIAARRAARASGTPATDPAGDPATDPATAWALAPRPGSPLTRLAGEAMAGIGHNQGPPLDPGRSGRAYAWRQARAQLMPRLPLEIVRRRVRRARELGLDYPAYASILLGSGRDIVAFLFTGPALASRLARGQTPEGIAQARARRIAAIAAITGAERRLLADGPAAPAGGGAPLFTLVAPPPAPDAGWQAARTAIAAALAPVPPGRALPADGVVMIGASAEERAWADAAALAKFLPADAYFDQR
ncbi:MAG: hypothetical protein AAFV86_06860 [Pseudomonadota bacterium]